MKKGVWPMFVLVVSVCLLVFVALAGANLLISNINSDELSNMGIEKKS
jgi:preprotein translocase subunit SecE